MKIQRVVLCDPITDHYLRASQSYGMITWTRELQQAKVLFKGSTHSILQKVAECLAQEVADRLIEVEVAIIRK